MMMSLTLRSRDLPLWLRPPALLGPCMAVKQVDLRQVDVSLLSWNPNELWGHMPVPRTWRAASYNLEGGFLEPGGRLPAVVQVAR